MKAPTGRFALMTGSLFAGLAVALGAFGSHALEAMVTASRLDTWHTAVRYQMFHALALLIAGVLVTLRADLKLRLTTVCFTFGTALFSGSLYLLVLLDRPLLGAVTPLGGLLYLVGWCGLIWRLWRWPSE